MLSVLGRKETSPLKYRFAYSIITHKITLPIAKHTFKNTAFSLGKWGLQQQESPWADLEREIRLLGIIFWRSQGFHQLDVWIIRLLLLSPLYWKKLVLKENSLQEMKIRMWAYLPTNLPIIIICGVSSVVLCFLLKSNSEFFSSPGSETSD